MEKFNFKKSLGQNFLQDDNIINKIVDNANIDKNTLVIEIGPGAGSLSKKIVPLANYAILYEIDSRLKCVLEKKLANYNNYEIIFNDFLNEDISDIVKKYNCKKNYVVANLPYYITTPIIVKLMKEMVPDKIVIMIQEEVADRLAAREGTREYGMISAYLGSKYDIKKLFKVSKNCFVPVPNVDSAVISLVKHDKYQIKDMNKYEKLLKDAFQFKRKNLKNNLKKYDLNKIETKLIENGYNLSNRAEDIPVSVFVDIANNL